MPGMRTGDTNPDQALAFVISCSPRCGAARRQCRTQARTKPAENPRTGTGRQLWDHRPPCRTPGMRGRWSVAAVQLVGLLTGVLLGCLLTGRQEAHGYSFVSTTTYDPLEGLDAGDYAACSAEDMDDDGSADTVVCGTLAGDVEAFDQNAAIGSGEYVKMYELAAASSSVSNGAAYGTYGVPSCGDIDGDDQLDCFVGFSDGAISRIEYSEDSGAFESTGGDIDLSSDDYTVPTLVDVDGDGLKDLFVATDAGTITFYRNTGSTFAASGGAGNALAGFDLGSAGTETAVSCADSGTSSSSDGSLCVVALDNGEMYEYDLGLDHTLVSSMSTSNVYMKPFKYDYDHDGVKDVLLASYTELEYAYLYDDAGGFYAGDDISDSDLPADLIGTTHGYMDACWADFDDDGTKDIAVGNSLGGVYIYYNTKKDNKPNWSSGSFVTTVYTRATVECMDWDDDGDEDIIAGNIYGTFFLLDNVGKSGGDAVFSIYGEYTFGNPFYYSDVGSYSDLACGHLTGDKSVWTCFSGMDSGYLSYFVKGSSSSTFTHYQYYSTANPCYYCDAGSYSSPLLFDYNDDDLDDLLVGNYVGTLYIYENVGSETIPDFALQDSLLSPILDGVSASLMYPLLYDFNASWPTASSKTEPELLLGLADGTFNYYVRDGGEWVERDDWNPFSGLDVGTHGRMSCTPLPVSDTVGCAVAASSGTPDWYTQDQSLTATPVGTLTFDRDTADPFDPLNLPASYTYLAPACVLSSTLFNTSDNTDRLDCFFGTNSGDLLWYTNNGRESATVPTSDFTGPYTLEEDNPLEEYSNLYSHVAVHLMDLDDGGLWDVALTTSGTTIAYLNNTGNATYPVFEEVATRDNPFRYVTTSGGRASIGCAYFDSDNTEKRCYVFDTDSNIALYKKDSSTGYLGIDEPAVSSRSVPAFLDVDTDGILDMVVGDAAGGLELFIADYDGATSTYDVSFTHQLTSASNPFSNFSELGYSYAAPFCSTLLNQSTEFADCVVGTAAGDLVYLRNLGPSINSTTTDDYADDDDLGGGGANDTTSPTPSPTFAPTMAEKSLQSFQIILPSEDASPFRDLSSLGTYLQIDCYPEFGETLLDCVVTNSAGSIYLLENTGTAEDPYYETTSTADNPFANLASSMDESYLSGTCLYDEDRAQRSCFFGGSGGAIYSASRSNGSSSYALSTIEGGTYGVPSAVDIDSDGDVDIVLTTSAGAIEVYYSDSASLTASYTLVASSSSETPFPGIQLGATRPGIDCAEMDVSDGTSTVCVVSAYSRQFTALVRDDDTGLFHTAEPNSLFAQSTVPYLAVDFADIDDDGYVDIFAVANTGDMAWFQHKSSDDTGYFNAWTSMFSADSDASTYNVFSDVDIGSSTIPRISCRDFYRDDVPDCVVGTNAGTFYFISMKAGSSAGQPRVDVMDPTNTSNPFYGIDVGSFASPECFDFDDDKDFDCVVVTSTYSTYVAYLENVGSRTSPEFTRLSFSATDNPFRYQQYPGYSAPCCFDEDGDGLVECFIGLTSGYVEYRLQTTFTTWTTYYYYTVGNPFYYVDGGDYAVPTCTDIDDDGDVDVLFSYYYGDTRLYLRSSKGSSTYTRAALSDFSGLQQYRCTDSSGCKPNLVDVNNDNDVDMAYKPYSSSYLTIIPGYYSGSYAFDPVTYSDSYYYQNSATLSWELVDLTNDGRPDGLAGSTSSSTILYYEANSDETVTAYSLTDSGNPFSTVSSSDLFTYAMASCADFDFDDDADCVLAGRDGELSLFENTGSKKQAVFSVTSASNPLRGVDVASYATPRFVDWDQDPDTDDTCWLGEGGGAVYYAIPNNDYSTPTFDLGWSSENPLTSLESLYSAPRIWVGQFTSDDDDDADLIVAAADGTITTYNGGDSCTAGYYQYTSAGDIACAECNDGYYSTSEDTTSCTACSSGKSSNSNHTGCDWCVKGTYSDSVTGLCLECPKGYITTSRGSTSCDACDRNEYSNANRTACLNCPNGKFSTRGSGKCTRQNLIASFTVAAITLTLTVCLAVPYICFRRVEEVTQREMQGDFKDLLANLYVFNENVAASLNQMEQANAKRKARIADSGVGRLVRSLSVKSQRGFGADRDGAGAAAQRHGRSTIKSLCKFVSCIIFVVVLSFIFYAAAIVRVFANGYLIVKSFDYGDLDDVTDRLDEIADEFSEFTAVFRLDWLTDIMGTIVVELSKFDFKIFSVDSLQVTCDGARAPSLLMLNLFVVVFIAFVMRLQVYELTKIAVSNTLDKMKKTQMRKKSFLSKITFLLYLALNISIKGMLRFSIQVLPSFMTISEAVPYFQYTRACDENSEGGKADRAFAFTCTALAYMFALPALHFVLTSALPGLPRFGDFFTSVEPLYTPGAEFLDKVFHRLSLYRIFFFWIGRSAGRRAQRLRLELLQQDMKAQEEVINSPKGRFKHAVRQVIALRRADIEAGGTGDSLFPEDEYDNLPLPSAPQLLELTEMGTPKNRPPASAGEGGNDGHFSSENPAFGAGALRQPSTKKLELLTLNPAGKDDAKDGDGDGDGDDAKTLQETTNEDGLLVLQSKESFNRDAQAAASPFHGKRGGAGRQDHIPEAQPVDEEAETSRETLSHMQLDFADVVKLKRAEAAQRRRASDALRFEGVYGVNEQGLAASCLWDSQRSCWRWFDMPSPAEMLWAIFSASAGCEKALFNLCSILGHWYIGLLFKVGLLMKLTVGFWDDLMIRNFHYHWKLKAFAHIQSEDVLEETEQDTDASEGVEDTATGRKNEIVQENRIRRLQTLAVIGEAHALVWQLIPRTVVLAKLAEAANESPLFMKLRLHATDVDLGLFIPDYGELHSAVLHSVRNARGTFAALKRLVLVPILAFAHWMWRSRLIRALVSLGEFVCLIWLCLAPSQLVLVCHFGVVMVGALPEAIRLADDLGFAR